MAAIPHSKPAEAPIRLQVRNEGAWIFARLRIPGKPSMELGRIRTAACDANAEVFEDFQALMAKCMVDVLKQAGVPEEAIAGMQTMKPGDEGYTG